MNDPSPPSGDTAASDLIAALRRAAAERPGRRAFVFLADGEVAAERLTYRALDRRARAVAALLQRHGGAGERVLLLLPPGLDFVVAFFGCLYAGAVAVPAWPPLSPRALPRLRAIARDAAPLLVLTRAEGSERLRETASAVPEFDGLPWLVVEDARRTEEWRQPAVAAATLAFLQYTSGSTAEPKGVMVSHGNLLANGAAIAGAVGLGADDVLLSWLPLYHDMGLIGIVIQTVLLGARCVLMSPTAFLQRPMRWLQAVARWRATLSGGPDFAWDLCVRRSTPEERAGLDLRRWRVAFNGAEPVRAETLDRFAAAFAPAGFRAAALCPCYGLAEATLLVSVAAPGTPPVVRERTERGRTRRLAGSGTVAPGTAVEIVGPRSRRRLGEGREGEIWVAGPQVAAGYRGRPVETARTFRARLAGETAAGGWLRTGDLGFLAEGELFVTGRIKDLIVLRGRNLHPQDVERTAEASHPGFAAGGAAAFAVEAGGRERLAVAQEVGRRFRREETAAAVAALRRAVAEEHEAEVYGVALLSPGTLPRTSSGKVRRRACRDEFLARTLTAVAWDIGTESGTESAAASPSGVLAAVARALGRMVDEAALHQPLAALGLDSLGAIELQHALETGFGIVLPVPELLAASAAELGSRAPGPPLPVFPSSFPRERGELSRGQRALWFLHRLDPLGTAYHVAFAAWIEEDVDAGRLAQAVAALVERHEILRTVYVESGGEPRAEVAAAADSFAVVAVGEESEDGGEALRARVAAEAVRPFDLAAGPVLRVRLFQAPERRALLVAAHHIAVDLWSLVVLMDELGRLLADPAAELPPAGSFADCVAAERHRLAGPEGERLWEFWRERLGGRELPVLDLPADRPRPEVARFRGAALPLEVEPEVAAALRAVAAAAGTTLFTVLLAAFHLLLGRLADQEEVLVGVPAAGRGRPELSGVVGYLVNPLVLRGGVGGDPAGWELLARARAEVLGALAHQDFPFPLLVERLQPRRDPGRSPVFQALFALERPQRLAPEEAAPFLLGLPADSTSVLRLGPLTLAPLPLGLPGAQLDLGLTLAERRGGLSGVLRYDSDLFDAGTAARWSGCFVALLAGLAARPEGRVAELPLLSAAEQHQLLAAEPVAGDVASVYERFAAQAARTPDAPALLWRAGTVTYRELLARVEQAAAGLARRGIGPEARVGVLLPRTPDLVVALLGVLHRGAAYVPLDHAWPRERLDWMIADAQPAAVISGGDFAAVAGAVPPPVPGDPGSLFAVIYTSGSTGRPKGVAIAERGVTALLAWAERAFAAAEIAGVLASTSVCFDLSIFELFVPLTRGGAVVLADNALELPRLAARERVTLVNTVPSAAAELVQAAALPASVRTVNLAGEPFPAALVRALAAPGRRLLNLYGPTETTVYSVWEEVTAAEDGPPPIGRPLPGERALVLDRRIQPLPDGVPGELGLGGAGVGRGYLGRPDATAERFVPDPWGPPGARLYRTGDRVRRLPGGRLAYLGRLDHQVKIRGFRIEPGEVEAVLAGHPAVREVAVAARPEPGGGLRLVAYVVPAGEARVDGLRAWLAERLPGFLVPAVFVELAALPRTANGKVDRAALPLPAAAGDGEAGPASTLRTPVEELLAGMWRELLGRAAGPRDDFFALGGHSLLAARLAARVRAALGVEMPLDLVFRAPTLERLAAEVSRMSGGEPSGRPPLVAVPRGGALPLTFAQRRLWFLDRLEPGSPRYNMPLALDLDQAPDGSFSAAALARALAEVVRRHEALRTRFPETEAGPVQEIDPAPAPPLPCIDLAGLAPERRAAEAERLAAAGARRAFDLVRGPVLRAALLRRSALEHTLLLTVHHIAADAWSLALGAGRAGRAAARRDARPAGSPDRRLRRLAARLAARRGPGGAARRRERAARRGVRSRSRHGPAASAGPRLARRSAASGADRAAHRNGRHPRPAARGHAVHGSLRGLRGSPRPLLRPGGLRFRRAGGGARPGGDGRGGRPVREHSGAARRPGGRAHLRRSGGADARRASRRPRAARPAVRPAGGGPGAGARPVARAALPGDAVAGRRAAARARRAGARAAGRRGAGGGGEARPHPRSVAAGRRARRLPRIQRRALRSVHGRAPGRRLPHPARRRAGRAGHRLDAPAAARRGGTPPAPSRVAGWNGARDGGDGRFRLFAGHGPLLGGAAAGRGGRGRRGRDGPDLERARPAGRASGPAPRGFGRGAGVDRRRPHRALGRARGRPARGARGRRCLSPARSGPPAGPAGRAARRCGRAPAAGARGRAAARRAVGDADPDGGRSGRGWGERGARDRSAAGRLCDLHLGLHRPAQGGGGAAPCPCRPLPGGGGALRADAGGPRPGLRLAGVRPRRGGADGVLERGGRGGAGAARGDGVAGRLPALPDGGAGDGGGTSRRRSGTPGWRISPPRRRPRPCAWWWRATRRLAPDKVAAWLRGTRIRLLNAYGVTEAAVTSAVQELETAAVGVVPIGRPLAHAEVSVLDRWGEPVPVGVPGELALGGPGSPAAIRPAGADRRALRAARLAGSGRAPVPHRRPRPLPRRRRAGASRPSRRSDQGAWRADRAG